MARALLVGCGCRGRELGGRLLEAGWQVRGTARSERELDSIGAAGIEAVRADPASIATVLDGVEGVSVVGWLLGSARGDPEGVRALHGPLFERLCQELVDTPVRGLVYEAAGSAGADAFGVGKEVVSGAWERWRIPFELLEHDPGDWRGWTDAAAGAFSRLTAG